MEAPPSPLSSRPELRRSVVERSAVSAVTSWKCFSTERTRISYFALLATSMQIINATGLHRNSWSNLRLSSRTSNSQLCPSESLVFPTGAPQQRSGGICRSLPITDRSFQTHRAYSQISRQQPIPDILTEHK